MLEIETRFFYLEQIYLLNSRGKIMITALTAVARRVTHLNKHFISAFHSLIVRKKELANYADHV